MFFKTTLLLASAATALAASGTVGVTPHDMYSSSVGVLGCKINVKHVAYWPMPVDCNNICVQVSYAGRSLYLLRIDQSGGAYDISYGAWNWLYVGKQATEQPMQGGALSMTWKDVPAQNCASLMANGRLPLSAANSMNYLSSCLNQPSSWVAQNHELYNILNPTCTYGYDEVCTLNLAVSNQPTCPHQLGVPAVLTSDPVYDIQYGTGKLVKAT
ncbi:hypothetical protein QBC46DRAFT_265164 [Diplogelasinospora grovesii]|uniref:Cerato-platanin n=1 Tax=Diplogelasinospora grovesii TaxID=303347 RepID=A0AAN6S3J7_9PEZI|nr:hypothetical protein QBC46DRAFT_265164 [Diplogelasinospora grovesii]